MKYRFHTITACNMCGSENFKILGRRLNKSQGLRPKHKIGISTTVMRCRNCGLIFSQPLPIPESINDHYGMPPETYWRDTYFEIPKDHFAEQTARILELAPHTKTFLDIGAGIGKAMRAVPFDAWGIEPSEPFRTRAIERMGINPDRIKHASMEDAEFPAEFFDCISFGVVLEHLYDPSGSIKKALRWLKPNGIIHIEVPDSNYLFSRLFNLYFWLARTDFVVNISPMHTPFHLYEFTEQSFQINGQKSGYSIARLDRYAGGAPVGGRADELLSKVLAPVMNLTKTGMGLVVYLRKHANIL